MNLDFSKIFGPRPSARENFELLIGQILLQELNAIPIDGRGGDGGIDVLYVRKDGSLVIFEVKYFLNNLTASQKRQIKLSFQQALQHDKLSRWVLCIPRNQTPAEKKWFDNLKMNSTAIEWWGETKIRNLLSKYPAICSQFFVEDRIITYINSLRREILDVVKGTAQLRKRKSLDPPSFNYLPHLIPFFIGRRAEISEIRKLCRKKSKSGFPTLIVSSIDGMPGIGKTALAIRIGHLLTPEFPDAQIYIDCLGFTAGRKPLSQERILDYLLFTLQIPPQSIPKRLQEKSALWRSVISEKKAVVILDNVKSSQQVEFVIPGKTNSLLLVTSRNKIEGIQGAYQISLDILSDNESVKLIKNIVGDAANKESVLALSELASYCGNLPLYLQIISENWKRKKFVKLKELLSSLNYIGRRQEGIISESKSIYKIFDLSYNSLSPKERNVFTVMGIYPGSDFTAHTCASMVGLKVSQAIGIIESLYDQSLISLVGSGRYKFHDLLRAYSRRKYLSRNTKKNEVHLVLNLINYYLCCLERINEILYPNEFRLKVTINAPIDSPNYLLDTQSAFQWLKDETNNLLSVLEYTKLNHLPLQFWQLSQCLSKYLNHSFPIQQVISIHSQALDYFKEEDNKEICAYSMTDLAIAHLEAGNFIIAETLFIESEHLWRALRNKQGLLYALNSHGFTLERLGRYDDALAILKHALTVDRSNVYGRAFTLNAMGAVHWRLEDYERALSIFRRSLKLKTRIKDYVGIASTTNNIAFSQLRLGLFAESIKNFTDALEVFRKYHNSHGEAVVLNNFGYVAIEIRDYRVAIKYSMEARDVASRIGNYYQIGRSFDVEGKALIAASNHKKGKGKLQSALRIFESLNVPEAAEVRSILSKLS